MLQDDREAIRANFVGEEDGHIYFLYRPKALEAHGVGDVECLYFVLHPFDSRHYRLISLDTSELPGETEAFNMVTGCVKKVDRKPVVIRGELEEKTEMISGVPVVYRAAARVCGEGVYTLLERNHRTHLLYVLEIPRNDNEVKEKLRIENEGNFTVGVYNPYYETVPETQTRRGPSLSEELKSRIGNQRIVFVDIPQLLDYQDIKISLFREKTEKIDLHSLPDTEKTADIFGDLKLRREKFPVEPLFEGKWR